MAVKNYNPDEIYLHQRIFYVLEKLQQLQLSNNSRYSSFYSTMRTMFIPRESEDYFSDTQSLDGYSYKSHSPEPMAVMRKAVNYVMSYLYSPTVPFFKTYIPDFRTQEAKKRNVMEEQFQNNLNHDLHLIAQSHNNYYCECLMKRDQMVFGHGAKVIEYDSDDIGVYAHIMPENVLLGSITGKQNEVVGYVSNKDLYRKRVLLENLCLPKENMSMMNGIMRMNLSVEITVTRIMSIVVMTVMVAETKMVW